jgi:hypothetical protein
VFGAPRGRLVLDVNALRAERLDGAAREAQNHGMPKLVVLGAQLKCSEGLSPSVLTVPPSVASEADQKPTATVMDSKPMTNVAPFGLCKTPLNPQVAAATSAAFGVLTPQPCIPAITGPWTPGSPVVTVSEVPALTSDSKCTCAWAGVIEIADPGTVVETF